ALALLRAAGVPIAAPSANRSNQTSPTTAQHVLSGLQGRIDFLLDAGATSGGLESTVLDLTTGPPRLLRPGLVTVDQLQSVLGMIDVEYHSPNGNAASQSDAQPLRSPGLLQRHYAPRAKLICIATAAEPDFSALAAGQQSVGWLRLARKQ